MAKINFKDYDSKGFYDEMIDSTGTIRSNYSFFANRLQKMAAKKMNTLQHATDRAQLSMGMTFNVYSDNQGSERILHLDIIPRIINYKEWSALEKGLSQRIRALNLFIADIYGDQKIFKDNIIPKDLIVSSPCFIPQCVGFKPPENVWCHITGSDMIRSDDGQF